VVLGERQRGLKRREGGHQVVNQRTQERPFDFFMSTDEKQKCSRKSSKTFATTVSKT
jgi:hypothetical protein